MIKTTLFILLGLFVGYLITAFYYWNISWFSIDFLKSLTEGERVGLLMLNILFALCGIALESEIKDFKERW